MLFLQSVKATRTVSVISGVIQDISLDAWIGQSFSALFHTGTKSIETMTPWDNSTGNGLCGLIVNNDIQKVGLMKTQKGFRYPHEVCQEFGGGNWSSVPLPLRECTPWDGNEPGLNHSPVGYSSSSLSPEGHSAQQGKCLLRALFGAIRSWATPSWQLWDRERVRVTNLVELSVNSIKYCMLIGTRQCVLSLGECQLFPRICTHIPAPPTPRNPGFQWFTFVIAKTTAESQCVTLQW